MDKNLKNALIIIGVLLVIYFWISPYRECVRDGMEDVPNYCAENYKKYKNLYSTKKECIKWHKSSITNQCGQTHSW
jgi:hypothetical protein